MYLYIVVWKFPLLDDDPLSSSHDLIIWKIISNTSRVLNCFSFGGSNAANTKKKASRVMREIFKSDELKAAFEDGKGLDGQKLLE